MYWEKGSEVIVSHMQAEQEIPISGLLKDIPRTLNVLAAR